jgi:hypothetical protein
MTQGTLGFAPTGDKKKKAAGAISSALELFKLLLKGKYIMHRTSHDKKFEFCLYEHKNVPVRFIKTSAVKGLKKLDLLRIKKEAMVLHRSNARKLHGNTKLKKEYKKSLRKK